MSASKPGSRPAPRFLPLLEQAANRQALQARASRRQGIFLPACLARRDRLPAPGKRGGVLLTLPLQDAAKYTCTAHRLPAPSRRAPVTLRISLQPVRL